MMHDANMGLIGPMTARETTADNSIEDYSTMGLTKPMVFVS